MEKLSGGCTLDCFDCCKFNVYVEDNKVVKVEGDKNHPYTKGFICMKGRKHLDRLNHPKRQYSPLIKENGEWKEISFEQAIEIIVERIKYYKCNYGSQSIMYYEQYGSGSVLKSIGDKFFNFLGGCYKQKGGPCWSAGMAAQKLNFGDVKSHSLEDMLNSKTIIVWGKNPSDTTIHTMQMIKKAQKNGSYVIVIDPICTSTANQADLYIQVNPGGDGALALAIGTRIIEKNKCDNEFINKYVQGFEEYKEYLEKLDVDKLCEFAGVALETVDILVEKYTNKYSTILLGYGLQKYFYGGNTISLIDALAAITGQIGESGGGVNYANKVFPSVLNTDPYNSEIHAENKSFYVSHISSVIEDKNIKMAVITNSNLLNQLPSANALELSLKKIEFKVCFDLFLTDTAESCDLFIPVTSVFEGEDLLYSSMTNPYLTYIEKAVEPENKLMDEYYFYMELAKRLDLKNYPKVTKNEYLTKVIEPLKDVENKMSLDYLKNNYFTIHESIAWKDKKFLTESGKFEIVINKKNSMNNNIDKNMFRILTTHSKNSLSSQHYMDNQETACAYINEKMAKINKINEDDIVNLESSEGKIQVKIKLDEGVQDSVVMMHVGWWKRHGNPNRIIKTEISDIGGQVAYNETLVRIYK